jgi:queuine tRNA-ribosyltransferase
MGVGLPEDVLAAIGLGIDMFDCVIPTRYARSATVFTRRGRVRLTNRRYRRDAYPIDPTCDCATCAAGFTRAYLHHLFAANEILSAILASVHNVRFYQRLVGRRAPRDPRGGFAEFREAFLADYRARRRKQIGNAAGSIARIVTSVTRRCPGDVDQVITSEGRGRSRP